MSPPKTDHDYINSTDSCTHISDSIINDSVEAEKNSEIQTDLQNSWLKQSLKVLVEQFPTKLAKNTNSSGLHLPSLQDPLTPRPRTLCAVMLDSTENQQFAIISTLATGIDSKKPSVEVYSARSELNFKSHFSFKAATVQCHPSVSNVLVKENYNMCWAPVAFEAPKFTNPMPWMIPIDCSGVRPTSRLLSLPSRLDIDGRKFELRAITLLGTNQHFVSLMYWKGELFLYDGMASNRFTPIKSEKFTFSCYRPDYVIYSKVNA